MYCIFTSSVFPSVLWHCWLGDRKGIQPVKRWVLVCWWWWFDWSFAPLFTAPAVTTTSITLSSNKIQNGDILILANPGPPGKWPLKRRQTFTSLILVYHMNKQVSSDMNGWMWVAWYAAELHVVLLHMSPASDVDMSDIGRDCQMHCSQSYQNHFL